jgi:hypothetical protein
MGGGLVSRVLLYRLWLFGCSGGFTNLDCIHQNRREVLLRLQKQIERFAHTYNDVLDLLRKYLAKDGVIVNLT